MTKTNNIIIEHRKSAKHGDIFFAHFLINNGSTRPSPVYVVGNDSDKEDIMVCSCTSQPAKTDFDIPITLKHVTYVRTNKIYTIKRNQLEFKINCKNTKEEFSKQQSIIKEKLCEALGLK